MPENPLEQARFDHVDAAGELVFAVGNLQFSVSVDETLERAILEAKQIRSESGRPSNARAGETLPISQIQSLIRAGADPSRVAERYGLSEALVRRFSAAVETEKQYAIEQFLTVPAPTESRMRTLAELIERTLASARIGMETLNWRATRAGAVEDHRAIPFGRAHGQGRMDVEHARQRGGVPQLGREEAAGRAEPRVEGRHRGPQSGRRRR